MKKTYTERLRSLSQEPSASVAEMGVLRSMKVVDLGAGNGYFSIPSAEVVGGDGLVYAVEPDPKRCARITERAASEGLGNIRVLTTKAENLAGVPSGSVDLAFSAFTMHHFEDRKAALAEVRRILREGGTFYLWDRVPGRIFRWGTPPGDLDQISSGFARFEPLETRKAVRARFIK